MRFMEMDTGIRWLSPKSLRELLYVRQVRGIASAVAIRQLVPAIELPRQPDLDPELGRLWDDEWERIWRSTYGGRLDGPGWIARHGGKGLDRVAWTAWERAAADEAARFIDTARRADSVSQAPDLLTVAVLPYADPAFVEWNGAGFVSLSVRADADNPLADALQIRPAAS